jgi:glutamate-1-semialdehyde 2,1-aminomutase
MTVSETPEEVAGAFPPRSGTQAELFERARALIPGGTVNSAVMPAGLEFLVERGAGAHLLDVDGRSFVDFVLGGGPLVLGHAHPSLLDAVRRAVEQGGHHYAVHRRAVELAERIVRYVPSAEMVRFTGSGSEATFHALRLARAATGRPGIVKFDGGYHGHHDLATWSFESTPSEPPWPAPESAGIQGGVREDVAVLPFNDPAAVRDLLAGHPDRFAAAICEPFQRAIPPQPGFLETLREACDRTGTVLVFDEIVTGFRFAPGGAQERYGVTPDLTTLGKALAGGVPLSALVGRRALMELLDPALPREDRSFQCGTFNGYLLGVECAHTTLDVLIERGALARLHELSELAADALRKAFADAGVPVFVTAEGGIFQPYFTDRPVVRASDVRAADGVAAEAFHRRLLEAGIYKLPAKGCVSIAHDEGLIDELGAASRWALARLGDRSR